MLNRTLLRPCSHCQVQTRNSFNYTSPRRVLGFPPFLMCPLKSTQIGTQGTSESLLGDTDNSQQAACFWCSRNISCSFPLEVLSKNFAVRNLANILIFDQNWSSSALCITWKNQHLNNCHTKIKPHKWFRRPCSPHILHPLWLLQLFPFLFHRVPWCLRGGIWWRYSI